MLYDFFVMRFRSDIFFIKKKKTLEPNKVLKYIQYFHYLLLEKLLLQN